MPALPSAGGRKDHSYRFMNSRTHYCSAVLVATSSSAARACYLRCQVLGCPTERLHSSSVSDSFLTEPEVCDFNMAVFIKHEILQLKERTKVMRAYFLFFIINLKWLNGLENTSTFCMNKPFTPSIFHTPWQGKDPSSYLVPFFPPFF